MISSVGRDLVVGRLGLPCCPPLSLVTGSGAACQLWVQVLSALAPLGGARTLGHMGFSGGSVTLGTNGLKVTEQTFPRSGAALPTEDGQALEQTGMRCLDCAEPQVAHYQMGIMIVA